MSGPTRLSPVPQLPDLRLRLPADRLPTATRVVTLLVVIVPVLGLFAAAGLLWGVGFHWVELGLFLALTYTTGAGITIGFHRLFTHRSFETGRVVQAVFAILGSMAVQGSLFTWVAYHRRHHEHSDAPGDPHSPHLHGTGLRGLVRGVWHSHIGWFFKPDPADLGRYVKDLHRSRLLRVIDKLFLVWALLGLIGPAVVGGLLIGGWEGVALGFVWGGPVRLFLVHHVTWSINSVCHLWGRRPHDVHDQSRNNTFFGYFALGEGWHNNHHAFPTSARHGLSWWQLDVSYLIIRALAAVGLAWNVKVPTRAKAD